LNEAAEYIQSAGYFLLSGFLPERTGYRRASDTGRAAIETIHPSLIKKVVS
jgi:chromosome partitioning protein